MGSVVCEAEASGESIGGHLSPIASQASTDPVDAGGAVADQRGHGHGAIACVGAQRLLAVLLERGDVEDATPLKLSPHVSFPVSVPVACRGFLLRS